MKRALSQTLKFTAFLALGLLLLYLAFRNISIDELRDNLRGADYRWIALAFTASGAAFLSRARRWVLLIRPLGYQPGFRVVFHSMMSGYLANMALPRMGEVTKCVMIYRREKIPLDKLIGTVITERVVDFLSLIIILILILLATVDSSAPFMKDNILLPLTEKAGALFGATVTARILTAAILIAIPVLLFLFRKKIFGKTLYPRIREFIKGVVNGIRSFRVLEHKWEFLFHSVFIWFCYIIMTWVVVFVLPATSHLGFGDGVFLLVIGGLGMSAPVQSGLGAFHWIISRGLHLVYGIPLADSLAYALISHTSQMILIAVIGTISLFALLHAGKAKSE